MKKALSAIISFIFVFAMLGGICMTLSSCGKGTVYYISSSAGNDTNSGTSKNEPWKSFANVNGMRLQPGDRILLKRGDVWNERLIITGTGEENAWITVSNYGDKSDELPIISMNQDKDDICILVTDLINDKELRYRHAISYVQFDGLDIRNSYLGIYFRFYLTSGNTGFRVTNCNFKNIYSDSVFENEVSTLDSYLEWINTPKGKLPTIKLGTSKPYREEGGGAGEYIWPSAIRFGGKAGLEGTVASEVDVNSCVFEDCTGGLEISLSNATATTKRDVIDTVTKVRMYDCVGTGTYNGIFRFENVNGGWDGSDNSEWGYVRNVRHLGSNHLQAGVTGPTASYSAVCSSIVITECELSYCYSYGGPDGCGFDFETYVYDMTIQDSVFHNNDGEAILQLRPGEGLPEYKNTHLDRILFYNNLKRPYHTAEQNYDIMTGSSSDDISFVNLHMYMPEYNPAKPSVRTLFFGPLGTGAKKENNVTKYLQDYRNRFAFNGNDTESWTAAVSGIKDIKVENGKLSFTLTENSGYILSDTALNLFPFSHAVLQLEGTTAEKVSFSYKRSGSDVYYSGKAVSIGNGEQPVYVPVSDQYEAGYATSMLLQFEGKAGDKVVIDSIEFTDNMTFAAEKISANVIRLTVDGKSSPFFESNLSADGFRLEGLPDGVSVTNIEQYNYNTVYLTLSGEIKTGAKLYITVNADQFIPYVRERLEGLDFGCRTPEQEAQLYGYGSVQDYVTKSHVTGEATVK